MIGVMKKFPTNWDELQSMLEQGFESPQHVAIIMDGNGRWAKQRALPRAAGHREGVKSVRSVVEAAGELGVEFLTLYTFSKENWQRPAMEVSMLMKLLVTSLRSEIDEMMEKNVRLNTLGDLNDLPPFVREELIDGMERTKHNTGLKLNLALSYGGRSEIVAAVKEVARRVRDGELYLEDIDEEIFSDSLYTQNIPDPDLLIRTSGEQRISNFLLWQLAYSELYITRTYWPDFRKEEFCGALINYIYRERRFGMVSEQLKSSVK
jgi:undecaprenyl diphosphate synthase